MTLIDERNVNIINIIHVHIIEICLVKRYGILFLMNQVTYYIGSKQYQINA